MDGNDEAELNEPSQGRAKVIADGMVESVAELLGQQTAEIVAHINRWSEQLSRGLNTIETGGGPNGPIAATGGYGSNAPGLRAAGTVRQLCPLCGCASFAWDRERATLCCVQCASTGRSRLMCLILERSGLLKRGVSVLDLTPEPGLAQRIQPLASEYRRTGGQAGATPENIDCAALCAGSLSAGLRARFDLLIHTHLMRPGTGHLGSALQTLAACLKNTGYMLFTIPIRAASGAAAGQPAEIDEGFDRHEVQRLLRSLFGTRLSMVDPGDYLTPQDFEFYGLPVGKAMSGDTIFAVAGGAGP